MDTRDNIDSAHRASYESLQPHTNLSDDSESENNDARRTPDKRKSRTSESEGHASEKSPKLSTRAIMGPGPVLARRLSVVSVSSSRPGEHNEDLLGHEARTAGDGEGGGGGGSGINFFRMSRDKKFTVITFSFANFCAGAFYAILGPFYPNEAAKKGVSTTVTGLIFGVFELVMVLTSPIFGNYLIQIGPRFMYCAGVMLCGASAMLFGFLDQAPSGTIYIVMCFVVRVFEALGAAAFSTASFSIMAHTFPQNVATMFGSLELFSGLGLMVGPPIGGALFQWGGFRLPFVSSGILLVLVGILSAFLLPPQTSLEKSTGGNVLGLLRIPLVVVVGLLLVAGAGAIGFLDVSLSIFLENKYHFTPIILGLVFLVGPGVYALTAPLWGYLADRWPHYSQSLIVIGYILGGASFFFMGPAPFIPLPKNWLWLMLVSLGFMGLGIGTLVISFQVLTEATFKHGYPDTLETYGLISGIFNSFFSFGAFLGPLAGGYLYDTLEFEYAAVVVGGFILFTGLVLWAYMMVTACLLRRPRGDKLPIPDSDVTERTPLLRQTSDTDHVSDHVGSDVERGTRRQYSTGSASSVDPLRPLAQHPHHPHDGHLRRTVSVPETVVT